MSRASLQEVSLNGQVSNGQSAGRAGKNCQERNGRAGKREKNARSSDAETSVWSHLVGWTEECGEGPLGYIFLSHLGGCARNLVRYVAFFSPLTFPLFGRGEVRESVASFAADSYSSFLSVFLNVTTSVSYRT